MREIKFRAWNKKENKWESLGGIVLDIETGRPWWTDFGEMMEEAEDVILVQYTGLKDKNGVEIYEGDVVRGIFYNHEPEIGKVDWYEKGAGFNIFGYPMNINGLHDIEVIGNIYENPELLKDTLAVSAKG